MKGLIGLVILILAIIGILDCIKSHQDNSKKALWIILIVFLPLLGIILYYLVAKKK
jgi:RsiW-degrading membrane proteinase PrsW (M82 family)